MARRHTSSRARGPLRPGLSALSALVALEVRRSPARVPNPEVPCNASGPGYDAFLMQGFTLVDDRPQRAGFGEFIVVDVETSGLQPNRHRVLSVAALTIPAAGNRGLPCGRA